MDSFNSGLSGANLVANLTTTSPSLQLSGVPRGLVSGRYAFKIDAEILTGSYGGSGTTFYELQRGLDGTVAAAHRGGVVVRHPIRGDALNQLVRAIRPDPDPVQYVRPSGLRAYLGGNFT